MARGDENYQRYLQGDREAFVEIVREYKDGLILYLTTFTHDLYEAEDLTQETFVKMGLKKPKDKGGASFKTWLYTIARNTAIDALRKRKKSIELPLEKAEGYLRDQENLEEAVIQREDARELAAAMKKLKAEDQRLLGLYYFEDFSCREIGQLLGKSPHAVETMLYRARQALKKEFSGEWEDRGDGSC